MTLRKKSISKEEIKSGFQRLGIRKGDVLGVHSSFSSLGYVEGGAEAVLEALFETVGHMGTLVMSTYLLGPPLELSEEDKAMRVSWKVKRLAFDDYDTPSGMGAISDAFRRLPDVVRWYHPVHSVSAWGHQAATFCQSFKPLVQAGGQILLLGVQMDRCSALHIAEEQVQLPEEIKKLMQWEVDEEVLKTYPPDQYLVGCEGVWGDFLIVQAEAENLAMIRTTQIGSATARWFEAKPMVELYARLLAENPYRMFGIERHQAA